MMAVCADRAVANVPALVQLAMLCVLGLTLPKKTVARSEAALESLGVSVALSPPIA